MTYVTYLPPHRPSPSFAGYGLSWCWASSAVGRPLRISNLRWDLNSTRGKLQNLSDVQFISADDIPLECIDCSANRRAQTGKLGYNKVRVQTHTGQSSNRRIGRICQSTGAALPLNAAERWRKPDSSSTGIFSRATRSRRKCWMRCCAGSQTTSYVAPAMHADPARLHCGSTTMITY